jgi:hypothetical protein
MRGRYLASVSTFYRLLRASGETRERWVADWVPRSMTCVPPLFPDTGDSNCLAGADTRLGPGALTRGGNFLNQMLAGVFSVFGSVEPSGKSGVLFFFGFRAAR